MGCKIDLMFWLCGMLVTTLVNAAVCFVHGQAAKRPLKEIRKP